MDVTPIVPAGRQVIERYGPNGFRISGVDFTGPVLVFPTASMVWDVSGFASLTPESLEPVRARGDVEILLIGCGTRMQLVTKALRESLKSAKITIDTMDTGAACRTYNVLMGEDRRVAAALIPPR
jgi:uncharacterized protein